MTVMAGEMTFYHQDVRTASIPLESPIYSCFSADRVSGPPREDLPLPTQPPYTAFIGNLAFDLTETELDEFFGSPKVRSLCTRLSIAMQNNVYRRSQSK